MNNNLTIYYCDSCAKSYGNVYKGNLKNAEFARGYIGGWNRGLEKCPFCGGVVIDTNLPDSDFTIIRDISDYNRQFLESMIQLYNDDIIEYELKMSQFRTQYDNKIAMQVEAQQRQTQQSNTTTCPRCDNTSFTPMKKKWSMWTGFATNQVELVCNNCGYKMKAK